ncbi:MAG: cohesin domain-containing protein [Candidatus Bathyarchaeia archaeon]
MNPSLKKFLITTLALMMAISPLMIQKNVSAQVRPKIYVAPAENIFYTDTTSVGYEFTVSIMAADWPEPGVFSYELKLAYDKTMLEATKAEIPDGHWLTPSLKPGNIFIVDGGTINQEAGYVSFAATLLSPEPGKTGQGTIAKVTLKIIRAPELGKTLSCNIAPVDVILVDPTATEIPKANYDIVPAVYQYISPPPPKPILKVSSHAWDDKAADAAGRVFNITVTIEGLAADWHVVGIQFSLEFNTTLLETKPEWVFEGDFAKKFGDTFFVVFVEENVIVGQLQLPPWPGPNGWMNGSGLIATIQFYAKYKPPPKASCSLTLKNVLLADAEGNPVGYERLEHGTYEILVAPPPWLSVTPKEVTIEKLGDSFELNVVMNELDKGFRLVGAEFKIRYNTSLLETKAEWIKEGDFMKDFAVRAGTDTFFQAYVEEDYGLIGIIILPLPNGGGWPYEVFPEGTGVLATIKFASIFQHPTEDLTTYLYVNDVLLADVDAKPIPVNLEKTEAEGKCKATLLKAYVPPPLYPPHPEYPYSVDLYSQYPDPYRGRGYGQPSDAFAPQSEISLKANVTYFGDAVIGKPVTFVIEGPNGIKYSAVSVTDNSGIAELKYLLPWNKESFGLWKATATAQIGTKPISDYMQFRVGYLFSVSSISLKTKEADYTDPRYTQTYPVYYKGKTYMLNMILNTIIMRPETVWSTVTIFDELGQPVAYVGTSKSWAGVQVKSQDDLKFVTEQRVEQISISNIPITIAPNAFSGRASVQASVLTAAGGTSYSEPTVYYIWIWKEKPTLPPAAGTASLQVSSHTVKSGQKFTVTVTIKDVNPDMHIVGIQFKLKFDTNLIKATKVTEGPFVKQFGETFFQWYIENDVLVGVLQLPPYPGPNGWMSGTGTLCTIDFEVIYKAPPPYGTPLTISDAFLVNANAERIEFLSLVHGYVSIVS